MTVDRSQQAGFGALLVGAIVAVVVPQGYWGYPFQALSLGAAVAVYFALSRPAIPLAGNLVIVGWLGSGVLAAVLGGGLQPFAIAAEGATVDLILLGGVLAGATMRESSLRGWLPWIALASVGLTGVAALLMGALPPLDPFWSLVGRQPQLLGSVESLEFALTTLILGALADAADGRFRKKLLVASIALIGVAAFLHAWAVVLATLPLSVWLVGGDRLRPAQVGGVLGGVALLAVIAWATGLSSTGFRLTVAETVGQAAVAQPWGYGRGGFDRAVEPLASPALDAGVFEAGFRFGAPDQSLSGVLVERGFLGLGLALVAVAMLLRAAGRASVAAPLRWSVLLSLATLLCLSDLSYVPPAWLAVGMAAGWLLPSSQGRTSLTAMLPLLLLTGTALLAVLHRVGSEQRLVWAAEALSLNWKPEAERHLLDYVHRSPDHFDGWLALGRVREAQNNFAGAAEAYEKALSIRPYSGLAAEAQTLAAGKAGDLERARRYVQIWLDSDGYVSEQAYYVGAYALATAKQNDVAVRVALRGLDRYPDHVDLRRVYGRLLMVKGQWTDALAQWERILEDERANVQDVTYYEVSLEHLGLESEYADRLEAAYARVAPRAASDAALATETE